MRSRLSAPNNGLFQPGRSLVESLALAVLALISISLSVPHAQGDEVWPTTRFKVFTGVPYIGDMRQVGNSVLALEREHFFGLSEESIEDIERAFEKAALWYKKEGFPAPALEPIINTENGLAYQIYVCNLYRPEEWLDDIWEVLGLDTNSLTISDWSTCGYDAEADKTVSGLYIRHCGSDHTRTKIMIVNSDKALDDNGKLNESGYQTLVHEFLHAIISNTPLGRSDPDCKLNKWISEGLPDALGYDIAEKLWKGRYQPLMNNNAVVKRHGYRPYLVPLTKGGKVPTPLSSGPALAGYGTSSFWRYIADSHPHPERWPGVLLTADKADSKSPRGLLDLPLPGSGWKNEVKWLDTGLAGKFNQHLDEMYGGFVSHFAFTLAPMERFQGKPAKDNLDYWVEKLFDKCATVDLRSAPKKTVTLDIKTLATACVWVEPTGAPRPVRITFQARSTDQSLLEDITIGRPSWDIVAKASPIGESPKGSGTYLATWKDFSQDGSNRTLYLVSNAAKNPARSRARKITLTVALPNNTNTARATVPLPSGRVIPPPRQPTYKKHAKTVRKRRSETAKAIAKQVNEDKKSLTSEISHANTISRRLRHPDCIEPFKYDVCGPHMVIGLDIVPGSYLTPGQMSATGGIAAQAFAGMQAMAQTSMWDSAPVATNLEARMDAINGSSVGIVIPLIDYGFSGTFSNASIHVDMSGGRTWRAIDPPDENDRTPLSGKVTIDEYTPFVITGSFTAPLAEFAPDHAGKPVYTRRQTVSGTFTSVAPWLVDERTRIIFDSLEEIADDIANTLGIPAEMVHSMKQDGTYIPASTSGGSGSSSAVGVQTECTCECSIKPFADELCELLCEEEFAACD